MATPHSIAAYKYNKANTKMFRMYLNFKTDADVIARLAQQKSYAGYIKTLIRQDIANNPDPDIELLGDK